MGVHETSEAYRPNVTGRMARDRSGSEYSENMSDVTSCSCTTSSLDKASSNACHCTIISGLVERVGVSRAPVALTILLATNSIGRLAKISAAFREPNATTETWLELVRVTLLEERARGSRPRDGIYINPMSAYIGEPAKAKDTESFYLHSPHDLVYTRITRLFTEPDKQHRSEIKDEGVPLTVQVDVHVNNGTHDRSTNGNPLGYAIKAETVHESSEHAYEQICLRQDHQEATASGHKKLSGSASDRSRPRKTDRRYSRSSSASESSNISSETPCFSSSASTPSLSRNSSNERICKNVKHGDESTTHEKKDSISSSTSRVESEKEMKAANCGASVVAKPPPPPPPPPPPDKEDVVVLVVGAKQNTEPIARDGRKDEANSDGRGDGGPPGCSAANKSDVSCGEHQQPEVPPASPAADAEETKASQTAHLVNKHMVLPFIPPQFANADSNTLLKPSEYLKSICKASSKNSLSKARSVDNLDIQSGSGGRREVRGSGKPEGDPDRVEIESTVDTGADLSAEGRRESITGPPPPPLSPLQKLRRNGEDSEDSSNGPTTEAESARTPQPLAAISIQDLTSIQLRRTTAKMNATKTFSAPPPRSVSMTNVSESYFVQKTDLIAELKRTKDIPGIKKLKVEMAQVEKTQEQNLMSEISKVFNVSNFVDQIPEKDSSGNVIPIWKRQMLARKAAERAKKELEEQIARENEERRQKAIPAWKRQLLAKKDNEEKRLNQQGQSSTTKMDATASSPRREVSPSPSQPQQRHEESKSPETYDERKGDCSSAAHCPQTNQSQLHREDDEAQIIPWRAQLRKTNSKLNILD